ncbi:hypothetical protein BDV93DRAFT_445172, partial [Ceratobasidium sp. AG-I]
DRFSAVVTDGAANVVRARKILAEETPTILNLTDPCHKLSLLIKDIAKLDEFREPIQKLHCTFSFFNKSTHATAVLTERRILLAILRGLEKMGKTRFGSVVRGAKSLLRCMTPIRQLVSEGAFVVPVSELNIRITRARFHASLLFETQLTVFVAVLDPILRALTCLESSLSTPADVLLFFSAALGKLDQHLRSGSLSWPRPSKTVTSIQQRACKQFTELINESPDDIYVTAFYLDPS